MGKIKVLFITSKLVYGGAEKMITFLINSLNQSGYNIVVYSYEGNSSNYKLDEEVEFIPEENIASNYFTRRFIQLFQVRKKIKDIKPDLVISFLTNQNVFSILGTRFTNIPVIVSERGDPSINTGLICKIKYMLYSLADGLVFQTEGARLQFNESIQRKGVVIPNPVVSSQNIKSVSYIERENKVAFVGRFDIEQKRQDIMLQAFKIVIAKHPQLELVFFGDGEDLLKVQIMVNEYDLSKNVSFAGKVNDVQKLIYNYKIFVLTSDYEGIPNALIEAMSIGLPVVATDCSPGGARLLIQNKENGILVSKGNIKEIAEGICFLLDNPSLAEEYGKEATKIKDTFSPQIIINSWENYINRIGDFDED